MFKTSRNTWVYIFIILAGLVVLPSVAFSSEIKVLHSEINASSAAFEAVLSPSPLNSVIFSASDLRDSKSWVLDPEVAPMNLWVLADSSSFCQTKKINQHINAVLSGLRQRANPKTRVTLVSYHSDAISVLYRQCKTSTLGSIAFECQSKAHSISYDQPLMKVLEDESRSDLPTVVWVYTSGNIDLSKQTLKKLKEKNLDLNIVLYNEFVEKEVRPVFAATQSELQTSTARFAVLQNVDEIEFPSLRYQLKMDLPHSFQGMSSSFELQAKNTTKTLAKTLVSFTVPLDNGFISKYGKVLLLLLLLTSFLYLTYKIYRYYNHQKCEHCAQPISFRYTTCLACAQNGAFLIGDFALRADGFIKKPKDQYGLLPLASPLTELGAHRKSLIRFPKQKGLRRAALIQKDSGGYQIIRATEAKHVVIRVNQNHVEKKRYLAPGDVIQINTTLMHFVYGAMGRSV